MGMKLPGSWEYFDGGDRGIYLPKEMQNRADKVLMSVINYKRASKIYGKSTESLQYLLFQAHPELSEWSPLVIDQYKRVGIEVVDVRNAPNAILYYLKPSPDKFAIVAHLVINNEPMAVVLEAVGQLGSLEKVQELGLLSDLEQVVSSASIPAETYMPEQVDNQSAVTILSGTVSSYYGPITSGGYKYYLSTSWYNVTPKSVFRMYQWAEQVYPAFSTWYLVSAYLTNNTSYTCVHDDGELYYRYIGLTATYKGQRLTSDFNPNYASHSITSQTAHLIKIADLTSTVCGSYRPF